MSDSPISPEDVIPTTASEQVEFISQIHLNTSTELQPTGERGIDLSYLRRYLRALEDGGFDYTLLPYAASGADSIALATGVAQLTTTLKTIIAVRPNTAYPTVVAQQLSTIDQFSQGRTLIHLISGGNDEEQARQGDYEPKHRRYARTREFLEILRQSWTSTEAFSHAGDFYRFDRFGPGYPTFHGGALPISIGGQSDDAFAVGGELADIFSFWGEPLAAISREIARVRDIARAAGRPHPPRFWATFRPIIALTDALAWEKARSYVGVIEDTHRHARYAQRAVFSTEPPQNVGSQRALAFAAEAEVHDRALWTRTAAVTNAQGASTALVGSPETVAAAILDYIDLGVSLISIRGYDNLNDLIDYGRYVLPLVRGELAVRARRGRRGHLQRVHLGARQAS